MSVYSYTAIDLSKDSVRLLRLCSGYYCEPIRCELFEGFLRQADLVPYEALSYNWGSTKTPIEISLNGKTSFITKNLNMALQSLRLPESDRILWVDALCIDQVNKEERSHQVGQMRLVYKYAERVLIWLGPGNDDTEFLFDVMKQLDKKLLNHSQQNYMQTSRVEWEATACTRSNEFNNRLLKAFKEDLLERPWFRRIWIIQEVASAKSAIVFCGWKSISTRTFSLMPSLMGFKPTESSQAVLDIMPGPLRTGAESWWTSQPDICTLLKKFWMCEAADFHDHIYALLGIASDTRESDVLLPDYTTTLSETHRRTMSFVLFGKVLDPSIFTIPEWNLGDIIHSLDTLPFSIMRWALYCKQYGTIVELLTRKLSQRYSNRQESLNIAAWYTGDKNLIKKLAAHDPMNINAEYDGITLLRISVRSGYTSIVQLLSQLLSPGGYINMEHPVSLEEGRQDPNRWGAALCDAAHRNYLDAVKLLCEVGAHLETRDNIHDATPLWISAKYGHIDVVYTLLEWDARIEAKVEIGQGKSMSVLEVATQGGHTEVVKLLQQKMAGDLDIGHFTSPYYSSIPPL